MKTLKDVMTRSPIAQYRFSKVGKTCSQFTVTQEIEHPDCTEYGDQNPYVIVVLIPTLGWSDAISRHGLENGNLKYGGRLR